MDRRPASDLFNLGGLFKEIELCPQDISNSDFFSLLRKLIYEIGDYTNSDIEVATGSNSKFLTLYTALNDSTENSPNNSVCEKLLTELKFEIKQIEGHLNEELINTSIAYPKSEYLDIDFLTREPWNLFNSAQILADIPDSIKEDIILFCQCYAYGIYTSAIIHILKATENYNIHFFEKISKIKEARSMHWGRLILETENRLDELHPNHLGFKALKKSLEDLKNNNRIEIIHKNKVILYEKEAFEIYDKCRIIISKMHYILKDRGYIISKSFN